MNEQHGPPQGKPHLLIHDYREFVEHVLIMGPQFFLVLQLVFLDEALIHIQGLPTRICKLPLTTARSKLTTSHRAWPLKARLLIGSATQKEVGQVASWGIQDSSSGGSQGRTFHKEELT